MVSFITPQLLQTEFNFGWLNADGLKPYINWGYINQNQFNQIINHQKIIA